MSWPGKRELTDRERAIIELVADYRILDGAQLQRRFFPTGTLVGSRRRTQATLKRLTDEQYLHRLERRVGGERAGSASFCYCLGSRGQRLLDPSSRARRPTEPGLSFVRHHLAVAQIYVDIATATEDPDEIEILDHQTEPNCWRHLARPFGGSEWLKPDLYLSLGVGDLELRWFIEVDLATESLRRIERACDRYLAYYRSGIEQAEHEVFPRVAWLASTEKRARGIRELIARRPPEEQQLFATGVLEHSTNILTNTYSKGGDHDQHQTTA